MKIDRTSDRPVYRQVADALRKVIRSGEVRAGEPLPSEARLMARYGVSRNTVRTAIGLLRVEGLVTTEQGRGSFVREGRSLQRLSSSSSSTEEEELDQRLAGVEVVYPPEDVADRLGLGPSGRALARRCVVLLHGEAVQMGDCYFPLDVAEARQPERCIEELTLRMPSEEEVRQLGISEGVPVVRVLRTLYDSAERVLEVSDFLLAGDRHVLVYEIPAH